MHLHNVMIINSTRQGGTESTSIFDVLSSNQCIALAGILSIRRLNSSHLSEAVKIQSPFYIKKFNILIILNNLAGLL